MTERIWAPVRPTLEPDAVALALLSPHGGDAAGDLGASLLGVHRAGAAACEVVAKGAVPSEKRLVEALAACRAKLGVAATDAVSKSMEERYAGLLVRDLLDDADLAALAVYRTCVSKGVAPPLAASRAGAVYGVPLRELGRYQTLASDPRVNPVALTDAADRALLGFVSKVVALEAGPAKEVVSKAPVGHARELGASDEGWDEREHPRSPTTGQFVHAPPRGAPPVREAQAEAPRAPQTAADRLRARLGLLDVAPEVIGVPEPPVQAPPTPTTRKPQQRQQRQGRQQRQVRQARQAVQPAAATARPEVSERRNLSAGPLHDGRTLSPAKLAQAAFTTRALRAHFGFTNVDAPKSRELTVPEHSQANPPHDLMQLPMPLGSGDEYTDIYFPLVFNVGSEESTELRVRAAGYGTHDNPRRLRAGWLIEGAGRPELFENTDPNVRTEADLAADHVAAIAHTRAIDQEHEKPVIAVVHPSQTRNLEQIAALTRAEMAAAVDWVDEDDRDSLAEEMSYIEPMTDIYTGDQVLVHWQPKRTPDGDVEDTYRRKKPMIVQYVLQGQAFRGREEGTGKHVEYLIDPNQALAMSNDYDDYWDSRREVVIRRYYLRPLSEAEVSLYDRDDDVPDTPGKLFGKALRGFDAVEFEQLHPRDTEGRFAPKASARSAIAPTALPTRTKEPAVTAPAPTQRRQRRQKRQERQVRQIRQAREVTKPVAVTPALKTRELRPGRTVQPAGLVPQQIAARPITPRLIDNIRDVFAERFEYVPDLPALNLDSDFRVFTRGQWLDVEDTMDDDTIAMLDEPGAWIPFRGLAAMRVLEAEHRNFDHAQIQLVNNAADDLFSNEHDIVRMPLGKPILLGESVDEEVALGHHIADAFDEWPEIDQIEVMRDPDSHYVQLYGNKRPVATQTLLEIEPGIDLSRRDLMLQNVGLYRTKQVNVTDGRDVLPILSSEQDYEGVGALNLPVRILRVTAPKVHYRRVIEDE